MKGLDPLSIKESQIKALQPTEKRYIVSDIDGLFLEVMPTGRKYWRVKHTKYGKRTTTTIGQYPAIPLADARLTALQLQKESYEEQK